LGSIGWPNRIRCKRSNWTKRLKSQKAKCRDLKDLLEFVCNLGLCEHGWLKAVLLRAFDTYNIIIWIVLVRPARRLQTSLPRFDLSSRQRMAHLEFGKDWLA
jgi:hypothetical protein